MKALEITVAATLARSVPCARWHHEDVFLRLRKAWNVESDLESLWTDASSLKASGTSGKGGAFFVRSSTTAYYLIKSLVKSEAQLLCKSDDSSDWIQGYAQHMLYHTESLMMRIYGIYSHTESKTYFMLIGNILNCTKVDRVYDLKGSVVHRTAKDGAGTLLDCNWLENGALVEVTNRDELIQKLNADVAFLRERNLMDYSLLIGIGLVAENPDAIASQSPHSVVSADGILVFFIGVIDYLQDYNSKKKMAHAIKAIYNDADQLSTVPAREYSTRFVAFIEQHVFRPPVNLRQAWEQGHAL